MTAPNEGTKNLPRDQTGQAHQAGWDDANQRYLDPRTDRGGNYYATRSKGVRTHFHVTPGASAGLLILAANPDRKGAHFRNAGTVTVFLDKVIGVDVATGTPVLPNEPWDDPDGNEAWYGRTAAGVGDIRGWETA